MRKEKEAIFSVPISELNPFPQHPFKVRGDEAMTATAESVRGYGVLVPVIVRPCEDSGYEMIAGHRLKYACELAGFDAMPVIIRKLDDNAATIIMADSNLQRENILPSWIELRESSRFLWMMHLRLMMRSFTIVFFQKL